MLTNIFKIRLTNHQTARTTFVLEPWGDAWPMESGATYEIHLEIHGDSPQNFPEIITSNEAITVYAGGQGDVLVLENGREINSSSFSEAPLQKAA